MRNFQLCLIAFILMLFSSACNKNKELDNQPENNEAFVYEVKYDSIIRAAENNVFYFSFSVNVKSGNIIGNELTVSLEGLPNSVKIDKEKLIVGDLLGGIFKIETGVTPVGNYPFKFRFVSEKYGLKEYNMELRVIPLPDFSQYLVGQYDTCFDYCPPDTGILNFKSNVALVVDSAYRIEISNYHGLGNDYVVRAIVGKDINIPKQFVKDRFIWGSGRYLQDGRPGHGGDYIVEILDTMITTADTIGCRMYLQR